MTRERGWQTYLFPLVIIAALVWLGAQTIGGDSKGDRVPFSDALTMVRQSSGGIVRATFRPSTHEVEFRFSSGRRDKTVYPVDQSAFELQQLLEEKGIPFDAKRPGSGPVWSLLTALLPFVLLIGFWLLLMRNVRRNPPTEPASQETSPLR
jgi:ATP-dependent Zn protease